MSRRKFETPATGSSDLTSTGMPWSEVPDSPCPYTSGWMGVTARRRILCRPSISSLSPKRF